MNKKRNTAFIVKGLRIVVGLLFVFSGFVKGVDPLGTAYKLSDYFEAFHIDFLSPLALIFSVLLNLAEFTIGVALLVNFFPVIAAWLAIIFMAVFTPLTFILAIYNPVTDCGCFGDAVIMTNWQTFYKNIVISTFVLVVFVNRKKNQSCFSCSQQWTMVLLTITAFLYLSWYGYNHLPIIDFRPYKTGTYIPEGMLIPEGAPHDSFAYTLVYEKEGERQEFSLNDAPYEDTSWMWIETKTKLVKAGYHPPIHDFSFTNMVGDNITDSIIHTPSYVFLAISYRLDKADTEGLEKLKAVYDYAANNNYLFYFATSSTNLVIDEFTAAQKIIAPVCQADDIMLKTVIRSNPGLVLIHNGTIVAKWSSADIPDFSRYPNLNALVIAENHMKKETTVTWLFFSLLTIGILAVTLNPLFRK